MRDLLSILAGILYASGDSARAAIVEQAAAGPDDALEAFLVSDDLWGLDGSIAGWGGGTRRTERRRQVERALIQIGNEQMLAGNVHPHTRMWVAAFSKWDEEGQ